MAQKQAWKHFEAVSRYALSVSPTSYLDDIRNRLRADNLVTAVFRRDTAAIFNWLIGAVQFQGISDANAVAFTAKHGLVSWEEITAALDGGPACGKLRSYWNFADCRYRKASQTCAEPGLLGSCCLPGHPTRKGSLIVAAYSLALFLRDVCNDDFVGWLDARLTEADPGVGKPNRAVVMGKAVLEPLRLLSGIGEKVWSMALADLLLAGDPNRERWVTTGAGMVVIDSLMHNHLHRIGVLARFEADHPYGSRCYAPGGCADLIRGLADRIDARQFSPDYPRCFPRFVQSAIWRMCSTSEFNICNGNRIDDRKRCGNHDCPSFDFCDRVALTDLTRAARSKPNDFDNRN